MTQGICRNLCILLHINTNKKFVRMLNRLQFYFNGSLDFQIKKKMYDSSKREEESLCWRMKIIIFYISRENVARSIEMDCLFVDKTPSSWMEKFRLIDDAM